MDTDWCIMCDSHCNIPGTIYCSEECKLQDRMENAYFPPPLSSASSSGISIVDGDVSGIGGFDYGIGIDGIGGCFGGIENLKHKQILPPLETTTKSKSTTSKVQLPPPQQQQPTLFYHRAPLPRYKTGTTNNCSSNRNLRGVGRSSKSLY
ncbi:11378_t:CDS:2 [Diversispora eburnea]|uniref:11378_t:CDS:1 n=1 Tax=Diversispora eburnea TaxID=1213867 RepID=A0A9N8YID8_9GLOM|nr:11378_t:CDS:2 [Diversispora eburnea]